MKKFVVNYSITILELDEDKEHSEFNYQRVYTKTVNEEIKNLIIDTSKEFVRLYKMDE